MARQQYSVAPYVKHLEVFNDFSGGLNTVTTNDKLRVNELPNISNMDLGDRGSIKRRSGMKAHIVPTVNGFAQGYFRYYTGASYKQILAVSGRFEVDGTVTPITGLASGFQATKPIEGVQFGDKMYFATGTDLVQYDGTTFSVVEPYKPQPLEALYIGTNGLSDDPDNFMADGESTFLRLDGVTFSSRYGVVNQDFTLTAYKSAPAGATVEYQFEWRTPFMEDGFWELGKDWSTSKTWTYNPKLEGDMQFRVNARLSGGAIAEAQYLIPKYKVKPSADPTEVIDTTYLNRCNRILLHWGRLIMYGDEQNPDTIYISHLNNPAYFPVPNSLRFLNPRREGLTSLVQYRDMIAAFTPTSIQALYGKSPSDFKRVMLNTSIGCIAPYSPAVVRNYIAFLSQEGVHYLKSLGYVEDKANVEKVDRNVDNLITRSSDVSGVFQDGQYQLVFPTEGKRMRMYVETGSWTKDESSKLNFQRMFVYGDKLYGQEKDTSRILVFDKDEKTDDGVEFQDVFELKNLDMGQPHHRKKIKEVQVVVSPKEETIQANVYVYADNALVLSPDESHATVDENGNVVWTPQFHPNLVAYTGAVMGDWELGNNPFGDVDVAVQKLQVSGNCLRTKMKIENGGHVLGFAYIFKLKKA